MEEDISRFQQWAASRKTESRGEPAEISFDSGKQRKCCVTFSPLTRSICPESVFLLTLLCFSADGVIWPRGFGLSELCLTIWPHYITTKQLKIEGFLLIDFLVQLRKIIQTSVLTELIKAVLCLSYSNCQ